MGVTLKAPIPWFGGKQRVAMDIWSRLGEVPNYVEPFMGSCAVLLARPHAPKTETVNDKCRFVSNFWRAMKGDPQAVADYVDWPVNEADLEARHYWLVTEGRARVESVIGDPDGFDAKVAGWWAWGICSWIGSGWCTGSGPWAWSNAEGKWTNLRQLPHLGTAGMGVNRQLPHGSPRSVIGFGVCGCVLVTGRV